MAKIDLAKEILDHDQADIIEYLKNAMIGVNQTFSMAVKERDPNLFYTQAKTVDIVCRILKELDRRNKEKSL